MVPTTWSSREGATVPEDILVDVTGVPAYRWTCPECGASDIAGTETEAVMLGRRHVAWSHPVPTALQLAARAAEEQTAS
jgi:hypothetical protein